MAIDYAKMEKLADRLIEKNGRQVTFIRPSEVPLDSAKPWNPPTDTEISLNLNCVFVPPSGGTQFRIPMLGRGTELLDDIIARSEQIGIVFPNGNDLRPYTFVEDESVRWSILGVQELMPSATRILAFVGLRR